LFEKAGQAEQFSLLSSGSHDLDIDREALGSQMEGNGRRLAGQNGQLGKWGGLQLLFKIFSTIPFFQKFALTQNRCHFHQPFLIP